MTELSTTNLKLIIYYLQSDIDDELKQLVLRSLKDHEVKSLYALCLSKRNVLIAEYLVREERSKRNELPPKRRIIKKGG